jgi:hypothetical protein
MFAIEVTGSHFNLEHGASMRSISCWRTVEDWATESLLAAREAYQVPETGRRVKSGTKLGDAYQAKNLPVARKRLAQAAMRLAMVLNEAFAEK